MVRFHPKSFAQPDLLKIVQPCNLIRLLEPCRAFLEDRGLSLPREDTSEIDYRKLSAILAQPDEWMDSHVVEGLYGIGNLGTDENFDELLDIARRNFNGVKANTVAGFITMVQSAVLAIIDFAPGRTFGAFSYLDSTTTTKGIVQIDPVGGLAADAVVVGLGATGVSAGTYTKVTADAKGRHHRRDARGR